VAAVAVAAVSAEASRTRRRFGVRRGSSGVLLSEQDRDLAVTFPSHHLSMVVP
jgi:hypothetical protein